MEPLRLEIADLGLKSFLCAGFGEWNLSGGWANERTDCDFSRLIGRLSWELLNLKELDFSNSSRLALTPGDLSLLRFIGVSY